MMDPTHTTMLSPRHLVRATTDAGLTMLTYLSREVRMTFDEWQPHVAQDSQAYRMARNALVAELSGGRTTGMRPFVENGELSFLHVWGVLIAGKNYHRPNAGS